MRWRPIAFIALFTACSAPEPLEPCTFTSQALTFLDADGDGFGDDSSALSECGLSDGRTFQTGDCDDTNPAVYPTAPEACNGLDDDCDAAPDDGLPQSVYYADTDGDGFGNPDTAIESCDQFPGMVTDNTDCDDANPDNFPDNQEVCDGMDNDCDGRIDDQDDSTDSGSMTDWYTDGDGDGFGGGVANTRCEGLAGMSVDGSDCNDANIDIHPNGQEVCSGMDENCDGLVDDADPTVDPAGFSTWYVDGDGDGFGVASTTTDACDLPSGFAANADDCDDTDATATVLTEWYPDADGDGVGSGVSLGYSCSSPYAGTAQAVAGLDCDDNNSLIFPGQTEVCDDGIDNDCSGADLVCGPIGAFWVDDGANWSTNPPVYSCLDACAVIFGGVSTDYQCSTSGAFINNQAFVSGFADSTYCTTPVAEDFKLEDPNNPGYQCGSFGCAYSAFVTDVCPSSRNFCWAN
jgi:hypothetical protein